MADICLEPSDFSPVRDNLHERSRPVQTASQRDQIEHRLHAKGPIYADVRKFEINTALLISDLLAIRLADVHILDPDRPELRIIEGKTGKVRTLPINQGAQAVINRRLNEYPKDVWLFQSQSHRDRQTTPKAITRRAVGRVYAAVGEQITPRVYLGTHFMRKTRGLVLHSRGRPIEEICKILNHANTAVTIRCIGLDADTVSCSYDDLVLQIRDDSVCSG